MQVEIVAITQPLGKYAGMTPDQMMAAIARVSNPKNQTNLDTMPKLLKHCLDQKHVSVFEQADMTVEIVTSRAISAQIIRHRSFCFQEFSQRYASPEEFELVQARRQDKKNRQSSIDDLPEEIKAEFLRDQYCIWEQAKDMYDYYIKVGVAKECARFLLPLNTQTTINMKGPVRSWIHYLQTRTDPSTQKEHREIAEKIKEIFLVYFPITSEALGWINTSNDSNAVQ